MKLGGWGRAELSFSCWKRVSRAAPRGMEGFTEDASAMPLCTASIQEPQTKFPLPKERLHPEHPTHFPPRLTPIVLAFHRAHKPLQLLGGG